MSVEVSSFLKTGKEWHTFWNTSGKISSRRIYKAGAWAQYFNTTKKAWYLSSHFLQIVVNLNIYIFFFQYMSTYRLCLCCRPLCFWKVTFNLMHFFLPWFFFIVYPSQLHWLVNGDVYYFRSPQVPSILPSMCKKMWFDVQFQRDDSQRAWSESQATVYKLTAAREVRARSSC